MYLNTQIKMSFMAVAMVMLVQNDSSADTFSAFRCDVDATDDIFIVYPSQLTFKSDRFYIFQLMNGLTVMIINRETGRFNRLSNLNLLPHSTLDPDRPTEPRQFFSGSCEPVMKD